VVRRYRPQFWSIQVSHDVVFMRLLILVGNHSDNDHGFVTDQVSRIDTRGLPHYQSERETVVSDSNLQTIAPHPFQSLHTRIVGVLRFPCYKAHESRIQGRGQPFEAGVVRHPEIGIQTALHTNPGYGKTCRSCQARFRHCLWPSTH